MSRNNQPQTDILLDWVVASENEQSYQMNDDYIYVCLGPRNVNVVFFLYIIVVVLQNTIDEKY